MSQAILQSAGMDEHYLLPGDFYFGDENARIHTLLGSCISIALWHPVWHIGGMSHSMLASRNSSGNSKLDGRYANEAVELFLREISKRGTQPGEYRVKLIGGGCMLHQSFQDSGPDIAGSNIESARLLLEATGFSIHAEHVGGNGYRRVIFDLRDGKVSVRHEKSHVFNERF